jgi:hypothetical protein
MVILQLPESLVELHGDGMKLTFVLRLKPHLCIDEVHFVRAHMKLIAVLSFCSCAD